MGNVPIQGMDRRSGAPDTRSTDGGWTAVSDRMPLRSHDRCRKQVSGSVEVALQRRQRGGGGRNQHGKRMIADRACRMHERTLHGAMVRVAMVQRILRRQGKHHERQQAEGQDPLSETPHRAAKLCILYVRMQHVLICTPAFPASEADLDCAPAMMQLVDALRSRLRITVIATQYPFRHGSYRWNGITVHACDGRNKAWRKPLAIARALHAADASIRKEGARHVHAFWLGDAAFVAERTARRHGLPCSVTLMGRDARDGRRWWNLVHGRTPPRVIALCERQAVFFERMSGRPVDAVVPFGLSGGGQTFVRTDERNDVLFCGSMYDVKRPLLFIDVIRRVAARRPVRAAMVGHGPLERVRKAIDDLPGNADVQLLGAISRANVLELMAASDVLLHTASYEGQCFAFDEAAAMGMRIVSTAVGSARPDNWWHVADDADGLAGGVITALAATEPAPPRILHPLERTVSAYTERFLGG